MRSKTIDPWEICVGILAIVAGFLRALSGIGPAPGDRRG